MVSCTLSLAARAPTILCLGAHSDDIEIGCGGAILSLLKHLPDAKVHWVVLSAEGVRADEARKCAESFAGSRLRALDLHAFPDGFFPDHFSAIKQALRALSKTVSPDLIFTTWRGDAHQDHRTTAELTTQTFRDHLILEYEICKYDGDLGRPNVFVPLEVEELERKLGHLMATFASQRDKFWFNEETFRALPRIRGIECRAPSGYAEGFFGTKLVLGAGTPQH